MNVLLAITLGASPTPIWCSALNTTVDPALGDKVRAHIRQAPQSGDPIFLKNGDLNPNYQNWMVTLSGPVLAVKSENGSPPLMQIALIEDPEHKLWVSTFVPLSESTLHIGEPLHFKGYIYRAAELDASGELAKYINSETLLIAKTIETLDSECTESSATSHPKTTQPPNPLQAPSLSAQTTSQGAPHD